MLDMENQIKVLTKQRKNLKSENILLKESNDSNIFVIKQLNAAL